MADEVKKIRFNENGKFVCPECENEVEAMVSPTEKAELKNIHEVLVQFPKKIIYCFCPVCGMEYTFGLDNNELTLTESAEEK